MPGRVTAATASTWSWQGHRSGVGGRIKLRPAQPDEPGSSGARGVRPRRALPRPRRPMRGTGPSAGTPAGPDSVGGPPWPGSPDAQRAPRRRWKKILRVAVSARREIQLVMDPMLRPRSRPVLGLAVPTRRPPDGPADRSWRGRQRTHAERRERAAQVVEQGRETVLVEGRDRAELRYSQRERRGKAGTIVRPRARSARTNPSSSSRSCRWSCGTGRARRWWCRPSARSGRSR